MPEYFHAAYIFSCKINAAISANKPKYTFLFVNKYPYFLKVVWSLCEEYHIFNTRIDPLNRKSSYLKQTRVKQKHHMQVIPEYTI